MTYGQGFLNRHGSEIGVLHRILDAVIIVVGLVACAKAYGTAFDYHYQLASGIAVASFLIIAEWQALYSSWRAGSLLIEARRIGSIWLMTFFILLTIAFFSKTSALYSRVTMISWGVMVPLALIIQRVCIRYVLRRVRIMGINIRSIAIVGCGGGALQLEKEIMNSPWMGLRIYGKYDEKQREDISNNNAGQYQDIDSLMREVHKGAIDCVYITYPMQQEEKTRRLVEKLSDCTASVYVVPDVFVTDLFMARWTRLGDVPLVSVYESPLVGANRVLKRLEDLILGAIILLMISPIMLVIALLIKLTSEGPILFKQRRYGLNGQVIEVWKFRSMKVLEDAAIVPQAKKNDPRITPLGAFLRRTSLDELPQFFNVMQGTMSIVGPRPHAIAHNEQYRKLIHGYMLRHKVKPGITGWAQVNGWRGETDTTEKMERRVQFDLDYINNWSLWMDLKIIWKTVFGGMHGKNVY